MSVHLFILFDQFDSIMQCTKRIQGGGGLICFLKNNALTTA
jgi:hypothetical protein